tara:strand:- start:853 stop:1107 length:255 start_codon:yes stop_codon:yes gene_type:complete
MDYKDIENGFEFLDSMEELKETIRQMEELKDSIQAPILDDINAEALRMSVLQTVHGTLVNFKTLLSLSTMFTEVINRETKEEDE